MKKALIYIIGVIVSFIVLAYIFSFTHIDADLAAALIIGIVIIMIVATLYVDAKIQSIRRKEVILENVGAQSYIDESNGTIYLYSNDYHTKGGQKWIVTTTAININQNWDTSTKVIPIIHIRAINLRPNGEVSSIIVTIHETYQHGLNDGSGAYGSETRIKAVDFEIDFYTCDFSIAQAIQRRVTLG